MPLAEHLDSAEARLKNTNICILSYSRRVTVVIRFLRKRWYTVSGVITYSVRSSRSYTRCISPLSAVLYGAYIRLVNGFERTHLIGWHSTVLC